MSLLTFAAALALAPYTPVKGDAAYVYTHPVRMDRFEEFVPKGMADYGRVAGTKDISFRSIQMEDAAGGRVMSVVFTPDRPKYRAVSRDPDMVKALRDLNAYNRFNRSEEEATVEAVNFSEHPPKPGEVVYMYTHVARRGRFADLVRSFQLPNRFSSAYTGLPRLTLADPRRNRVLSYVFYPDQAAADNIHRSNERGRILLGSDEYRASFTAERWVVAAVR